MPEKIRVADLLRGYQVDRSNIQSVGNMTLIPIIGDVEFTNVANHNDVMLERDASYNELVFKNASGNIGIAIQGFTIMSTRQRAQDRTIPYAHLIKGHNAKVIPANCLQPTQGGLFNARELSDDEFMVLPPSLRALGMKRSTPNSSETSALWDDLEKWTGSTNCRARGLVDFYSKFEDRLGQFVAQFEAVEHQLGAIVLINGNLVAIDIMPMYSTWKALWRALIRDSYGAESIRIAEQSGAVVNHPSIGNARVETLDDLIGAYSDAKEQFVNNVEGIVGATVESEVNCSRQDVADELTLMSLESSGYKGQAVFHGSDHVVYMSLVTSSSSTRQASKLRSLRNDPYGSTGFRFR